MVAYSSVFGDGRGRTHPKYAAVFNSSSTTFGYISGPVDHGVWREKNGELELVAQTGKHAPGTHSDVNFYVLGAPKHIAAETIAFSGELTGPGIDETNNAGVWVERNGGLELIAREGDSAPGTDTGVVFSNMSRYSPDLEIDNLDPRVQFFFDDQGRATISTELAGPGVDETNNKGIWTEIDGELSLIIRSGQPLAGLEPGITINHFGGITDFPGTGYAALRARLTGPGVDDTIDWSLWAIKPGGEPILIVREGDLFDIDNDPVIEDLRTIRFASLGGQPNASGQVPLNLLFTDNSRGIFVATIPEPTSVMLLVTGLGLIFQRSR